MPSLADTQSRIRDGVVTGFPPQLGALIHGGRIQENRLRIHRRNYESSLIKALLEKFPGTVWLVGSEFVRAGAGSFVRKSPPLAPCIAEYGWDFPRFLGNLPGAVRVPYLNDFAQLEWCVGHVSIAVTKPEIDLKGLAGLDASSLAASSVQMQSGVFYFKATWPVDELLTIYVNQEPPNRLRFDPEVVWLEVRGSRGNFHIKRLGPAEFVFRRALSEGISIGEAAEVALAEESEFDPGRALRCVVSEGLVTQTISDNLREDHDDD